MPNGNGEILGSDLLQQRLDDEPAVLACGGSDENHVRPPVSNDASRIRDAQLISIESG
jgi:hypothetical protein